MRICYFVPSWFTLAYQIKGQVGFLRQKGADVVVISENDDRARTAAIEENATYYPLNFTCVNLYTGQAAAILRALKIVIREDIDIVCGCTKLGGIICALANIFIGKKCVYVLHGVGQSYRKSALGIISIILDSMLMRLSTCTIFLSRSNQLHFHRFGKIGNGLVLNQGSVNGVNCQKFYVTPKIIERGKSLRQRLQIPQGAFIIGFVGRLSAEKGLIDLFAAWKMIRSIHDHARLLIVSPPEIDPELIRTIKDMQSDERIHFAGFMDDPVVGYALMDALVLPSYAEGFPTVTLEAAAARVPVVAYDVIGCVDAVRHEETGLLCEAHNINALTSAIDKLIRHPEETKMLGENARIRVGKYFSQNAIWEAYWGLFSKLTSKDAGNCDCSIK